YAVNLLQIDINVNKSIGDFGAKYIKSLSQKPLNNVLTHCNTGSLATAGYGTALGVIRSLHSTNSLSHAVILHGNASIQSGLETDRMGTASR
ncbi:unnamed protein product, partial [Oppiella nova]